MKKADNIIRIPTSLTGNFFRYWFMFLKPFHKLTGREIDVISCLVKKRYELSKVIKDTDILDKVVMSDDTKKQVKEECNMNTQHFQVVMSKLKKGNIIVDNKINPKYIPNLSEDSSSFSLLLYFDLK